MQLITHTNTRKLAIGARARDLVVSELNYNLVINSSTLRIAGEMQPIRTASEQVEAYYWILTARVTRYLLANLIRVGRHPAHILMETYADET